MPEGKEDGRSGWRLGTNWVSLTREICSPNLDQIIVFWALLHRKKAHNFSFVKICPLYYVVAVVACGSK